MKKILAIIVLALIGAVAWAVPRGGEPGAVGAWMRR